MSATYRGISHSSTMHRCTVQCDSSDQLETSSCQSSPHSLLKLICHPETTCIVKQYILLAFKIVLVLNNTINTNFSQGFHRHYKAVCQDIRIWNSRLKQKHFSRLSRLNEKIHYTFFTTLPLHYKQKS